MNARQVASAWRDRAAGRVLPAALVRACNLLARRVAADAPVDSGGLRDSVHATPARVTRSRVSAAVVVSSPHALAVEYGTADTRPEPFFRPAIRSELPRMRSIVEEAAGP